MKLTMLVKLAPTDAQRAMLLETMEQFNRACNSIAEVAFHEGTANKFRLQKLVYYQIRADFGLSSSMAVRAIAKVAGAYKRNRAVMPRFKLHGGMAYDSNAMSWKGLDRVSLLTLHGRQIIPVLMGPYHQGLRERVRGNADLIYRDGTFFLGATVDVPDGTPYEPADWLGIDFGIVNIAADSEGTTYTGGHLSGLRARHTRLHSKLQKKGTRAAKRLLKKRRRKEARFAAHINHTISKRIVTHALRHNLGIGLENLTHINERVTVRKAHRRQHSSWAFAQLRSFIEYKARLLGVPVVIIDPRNTSRTCPACNHVAMANRRTQSQFLCVSCGFGGPADTIAAVNIGRRAAGLQPHAAAS